MPARASMRLACVPRSRSDLTALCGSRTQGPALAPGFNVFSSHQRPRWHASAGYGVLFWLSTTSGSEQVTHLMSPAIRTCFVPTTFRRLRPAHSAFRFEAPDIPCRSCSRQFNEARCSRRALTFAARFNRLRCEPSAGCGVQRRHRPTSSREQVTYLALPAIRTCFVPTAFRRLRPARSAFRFEAPDVRGRSCGQQFNEAKCSRRVLTFAARFNRLIATRPLDMACNAGTGRHLAVNK
jgi:hypothetical protein